MYWFISIIVFFIACIIFEQYGIIGMANAPTRRTFIKNISCYDVANSVKTYFTGILSVYGNSYEILTSDGKYKIYMDFEPHMDGIICNISVAPTKSAINYGKKMEQCTALLNQTIATIGTLIKEKHKESTTQDS